MSDENKEPPKLPETIEIEIDVKKYINIFLNKLKQICKLTLKLCIIFIVINLLIFIPLISKSLQSTEYPIPKTLLKISHLITRIYIIPIKQQLDWRNSLSVPFSIIRDKLYNKGIQMLPENSPEREVWWYNTKFLEFASVIEPQLYNWLGVKTIPFTNDEIMIINTSLEDVYNHILIFPKIDFRNTIYYQKELFIYRDMILMYAKSSDFYSVIKQQSSSDFLENPTKKLPGPTYDAVKHNIELIDKFDTLKEKIKKENQMEYEKYMINIVDEYIMKKTLLNSLLLHQETFSQINCESYEFKMWQNFRLKIIDHILEKHPSPIDDYRYQISLMTAVNTSVCPMQEDEYSKKYEKLSKYYKEIQEEYHKNKKKNQKEGLNNDNRIK